MIKLKDGTTISLERVYLWSDKWTEALLSIEKNGHCVQQLLSRDGGINLPTLKWCLERSLKMIDGLDKANDS